MKFVTLIAASCLLAGAAFAASPEQALIDVENAWAKAYPTADTAAIASHLGDERVGQSDSPARYTKAAFLADIKSGKLAIKAITLKDMKVHVLGTTAVVMGYDDETSSWGKENTSGTYSWIDVFVNRGGKWVAIASQITKVKK